MKVYILIQNLYMTHEYDEDNIVGVFSSMEVAENNRPMDIKEDYHNSKEGVQYRIQEFEVKDT